MQISYDLNALQTFVLVAEDLSFTTVADRKNTVQSAISAQIKKLENALGQTLVSRGRGQAMRLTAEGEAFLVYARRILELSQDAAETVRTTNARQVLRLGTTVTLALSVVADVLRVFAEQRPDIQIQIQCDRSDQLLHRLDVGEIDVAFMMDQGRHGLRKFVHSMDLNWVCAQDFHLPETDLVPLAFLSDGRDLRHYALRALDSHGRKGHVSHLSPHPIGVRSLVLAGLALTVMPSKTIVAPLVSAPSKLGLPQLAPIAISAYERRRDDLAGADLLVSQLKEALI